MFNARLDSTKIALQKTNSNQVVIVNTVSYMDSDFLYTGKSCDQCKDWHNNLDFKAEKYSKNFPLTGNPFKKWHVNCKCSCHKG